MKQNMLASIVAYALMWAWLMYIKGETMPSQILDIADLHLPEKPVSVVPDFKNGTPLGVWSEAFVFSAQNNRDGKFDLHCKYMTAENVFRRHAVFAIRLQNNLVDLCAEVDISYVRRT